MNKHYKQVLLKLLLDLYEGGNENEDEDEDSLIESKGSTPHAPAGELSVATRTMPIGGS